MRACRREAALRSIAGERRLGQQQALRKLWGRGAFDSANQTALEGPITVPSSRIDATLLARRQIGH